VRENDAADRSEHRHRSRERKRYREAASTRTRAGQRVAFCGCAKVATVRRLAAAVSLALALSSASAGQASAGPTPRLTGPVSVVPGVIVSFRAHGFRPGSQLEVVVAPADRPSCCAARIPSSFSVSALGNASLTFRMPSFYRRCISAAGRCRKVRWRPHERLAVTAFGYLQEATIRASIAL
jgi:hypothetical protein